MVRKLHFVTAAMGSILAVSLAGAQTHGMGVSVRMPSTAVRPTVRVSGTSAIGSATGSRAVRPAGMIRIVPGSRVISGFAPSAHPAGTENGIGVPGLGFDYPHLAAISGGLRGDGRRGFEQRGHLGQGFAVPIYFGGYPYYLDGSLDYEQPEQADQAQAYQTQPQPQIIVIQQPVPAPAVMQSAGAQETDSGTGAGQSPALPSSAAESPVQNVGEIILIRKDGRVLFASAFSVVGTQLRYISPEGILHKFPITELDSESTVQMNEARGNTVQINN